jgi:hypothetical protein
MTRTEVYRCTECLAIFDHSAKNCPYHNGCGGGPSFTIERVEGQSVFCVDCKYYENLGERMMPTSGLCHRRAPSIVKGDLGDKWPIVEDGEWCGEYEEYIA